MRNDRRDDDLFDETRLRRALRLEAAELPSRLDVAAIAARARADGPAFAAASLASTVFAGVAAAGLVGLVVAALPAVAPAVASDLFTAAIETLTLTISNPTHATLGRAAASGTIVDDDEATAPTQTTTTTTPTTTTPLAAVVQPAIIPALYALAMGLLGLSPHSLWVFVILFVLSLLVSLVTGRNAPVP